jgi:hypothetical protein
MRLLPAVTSLVSCRRGARPGRRRPPPGHRHQASSRGCPASSRSMTSSVRKTARLRRWPARCGRTARGGRVAQPYSRDLSTSTSQPGKDGSKPCSTSQRTASRLFGTESNLRDGAVSRPMRRKIGTEKVTGRRHAPAPTTDQRTVRRPLALTCRTNVRHAAGVNASTGLAGSLESRVSSPSREAAASTQWLCAPE